ncbi:MAG: hypothetical protein IIT57_02185, partial [Treponema sp.]|nr:hypothetical protein [Treponema sp.]
VLDLCHSLAHAMLLGHHAAQNIGLATGSESNEHIIVTEKVAAKRNASEDTKTFFTIASIYICLYC